jgi:hypothetical protein
VNHISETEAAIIEAAHASVESQISESERLMIWNYLEAEINPALIAAYFPTDKGSVKAKVYYHCLYLKRKYFT